MSSPEIRGAEAILSPDADHQSVASTSSGVRSLYRGWTTATLPVGPLLLAGAFLGPRGLSVLSPSALATLDPAMPVALATLGVLAGLAFEDRRGFKAQTDSRAAFLALSTIAVVALGALGAVQMNPSIGPQAWLWSLACGVSAASSLGLPVRSGGSSTRNSDVFVESEAVVTVVAGGVLLALAARDTTAGAGALLIQGIGITAVLALAGWLLARRTVSTTERRVFAMATILLIGGAADLLSSSPLLAGLVAGLLWQRLGGASREALAQEIRYLQHPFVVLVLLAAGAGTEFSWLTFGLGCAYASLRCLVRFVAASGIARTNPTAAELRLELVAPGVFGVAFALSLLRALGTDATGVSSLLSVVVLGTVLSDVIARLAAAPRSAA